MKLLGPWAWTNARWLPWWEAGWSESEDLNRPARNPDECKSDRG